MVSANVAQLVVRRICNPTVGGSSPSVGSKKTVNWVLNSKSMRPFHLAFPVTNLTAIEEFYGEKLGCKIGRRTPTTINFNFFGHQLVAHEVSAMPDFTDGGKVDGKRVPPFHFGLVMDWEQWHKFRDRIKEMELQFRIKPHTRYPGKIGEQATMFIDDPAGNSLEFKSFIDDDRLFATLDGEENTVGGGKIPQQNPQ